MDLFKWIDDNLRPEECTSVELLYDCVKSQSGESLPVIYRPFDPGERSHWCDRGAMLDFLHATRAKGGRVLDFGPGDGWPSLIIAPHVGHVVGVDGSDLRVRVCRDNAGRLGIDNVEFLRVGPGERLPFDNASFDGVLAASSVEQVPDPKASLGEFYRVLKPGGRLRMTYEDLDRYRDSSRYDTWLWSIDGRLTRLVLYDRHIEDEYAVMYGITFSGSPEGVGLPLNSSGALPFEKITVEILERLRSRVSGALSCRLTHPSGRTFSEWLNEAGFSEVIPSHSGVHFAGELFDRIPPAQRPGDIDAVDALLSPAVSVVVEMRAPLASNPWITAAK